jgi:hypothetical protein
MEFEDHRIKVQGDINTILSRDTPLSRDTSAHQISMKNLYSFRRYRAEGNYYAILHQGHWVKVKGRIDTNSFATHLCPPIHSHTKFQPKIFIRLGISMVYVQIPGEDTANVQSESHEIIHELTNLWLIQIEMHG